MTEEEKMELFEKYQNIAREVAWKMNKKFPLMGIEDMLNIAEYALYIELFETQRWSADKGTKLSSWLYTCVYHYLLTVCTRGVHPKKGGVPIREWDHGVYSFSNRKNFKAEDKADPSWLDMFLVELGEEAFALVGIVLDAPKEIASALTLKKINKSSVKRAQDAVRYYMIDELDWTNHQVEQAWREVQASMPL